MLAPWSTSKLFTEFLTEGYPLYLDSCHLLFIVDDLKEKAHSCTLSDICFSTLIEVESPLDLPVPSTIKKELSSL